MLFRGYPSDVVRKRLERIGVFFWGVVYGGCLSLRVVLPFIGSCNSVSVIALSPNGVLVGFVQDFPLVMTGV